jgi:hypothetical protein
MARRLAPRRKAGSRRHATAKAARPRVVPRVVIDEYDARERQLPTGDRDDAPAGEGEDLGPIVLPTPDDSRRVLEELARLYHDRFDAMRRHDELHTAARNAAAAVQQINERIAERIRIATHRTGLPLFTAMEHEAPSE